MTKQEAIYLLNNLRAFAEEDDDPAIDMAIEALQDDWIPVSERLPEEDKEVLVTVYFKGLDIETPTGWVDHIKPSTYVETASHMDGEWYSVSDEYKVARNRHRVIAWKPLPKPYVESEE